MSITRLCACGCGREFETDPPGSPGRPRLYYNATCRDRARRQRAENERWIKAVEGDLHVPTDPPAKQIANSIAEAAVIAAAFRRLAIEESNPVLAAGCEHVYLAIIAALNRYFPGWSA